MIYSVEFNYFFYPLAKALDWFTGLDIAEDKAAYQLEVYESIAMFICWFPTLVVLMIFPAMTMKP